MIAGVLVAALLSGGCSALRADPRRCRIVTTVAGAVLLGGIAAGATGASKADTGAVAAATIGSITAGALAGLVFGAPICGTGGATAPAPPPTPSPAPSPPPSAPSPPP